jgi:hypothetical protein
MARRKELVDHLKANEAKRNHKLPPGEKPASEYDDRLPVDRNGDDHLPDDIGATPPPPAFPKPPAKDAYFGLAGELVEILEPHTEADATAILLQTLVSFGSVIGRTAFFQVEGNRHYLNLFAVLVGTTSKGRKGTSWGRVRHVFAGVAPEWDQDCVLSGLSSGEGLIWQVRDAVLKMEPVKEKGRVTGSQEVEVDPGVKDKRVLVQEAEFCSVLKQTERQGNTLSTVIRQAWETGNIRVMTKNSPVKATEAHISIIGHVTADELRRYLSSTEAASGFGNRFLWAVVKRSKYLPDGGALVELPIERFSSAASFAKAVGKISRDDEARQLWHEVYPQLSGDRPGLAGSLLARAEAQTMRLACLYALLDCSFQVEVRHLKAALALWDFCERSTKYIFGSSTGDPVADKIMDALRHRPEGMTRTEIRDLFLRHQQAERIDRALALLLTAALICREQVSTGGRPSERFLVRRVAT